jgi:hypothetical protein
MPDRFLFVPAWHTRISDYCGSSALAGTVVELIGGLADFSRLRKTSPMDLTAILEVTTSRRKR